MTVQIVEGDAKRIELELIVTSYFNVPASVGWLEENLMLVLSLYTNVVSSESTKPLVIVEAAELRTTLIL